jgi:4-hydroxythreonine-4-phosphate dehydrogenase
MKNKYIIVMLIDHESVTEKIIIKSIKFIKKSKCKILFVGDINCFKILKKKIIVTNQLDNNFLNKKFFFYNVSSKKLSNFKYINKLTTIAIQLLKKNIGKVIINMPINKKKYFKNKFDGFTEFFSNKMKGRYKENMLLYNEKLSVLPLTTHIKIKDIAKSINSKKITKSVENIFYFYNQILKKKINVKILGLNPHSGIDFSNNTEEKDIIEPAVIKLRRKFKRIEGPLSPDTAFINNKIKNTCFLGMYHDQVLTVFKNLFKFEAANITIGLKYLRLSPDHGTGKKLIKSRTNNINNRSFLYCLKFCEKYIKS